MTRYRSLDVLRGLTIAFMIIVNSPGNAVAGLGQLRHAAWNGFTLTDLVFPTFLFVVGNAMSFTMLKYNKEDQKSFLVKVFKRTLIIYFAGVFLNAYPFFHLADVRLVHVLGRIALCYCAVSLLIYYAGPVTAYVVSVFSLLAYWWILYQFGDQPDPYGLEGNAVAKLDLVVFGTNHIWHGEGVPFDPEGLLSTLPAIANVTAGYFIGQYIQRSGASRSTVLRLIIGGLALVTIGVIWNEAFPINKKLWTSSYVVLTVGLDLLILAILLYVIEILKIERGVWFFEVFGRNPLALYVLSYLITKPLYYITGAHFVPLVPAVTILMIVWLAGYLMDKRKIYLKV